MATVHSFHDPMTPPNAIIEMVDVNQIEVPSYQSEIVAPRLKRIIETFDPEKVGFVYLSLRENGKLYVVDGQHRVEAIRFLQRIVGPMVPAIVQTGMTTQAEAKFFTTQSATHRRTVTPDNIHHASLEAGDQTALAIERIVRRCGYYMGNRKQDGFGRLRPVSTVYEIAERYGYQVLADTLTFVTRTWGAGSSPEQALLHGIALFIGMFPGANLKSVEHDAGADDMKTFIADCKRAGGRLYSSRERVALQLHTFYNRRNRKHSLPPFEERLQDHKFEIRAEASREARARERAVR